MDYNTRCYRNLSSEEKDEVIQLLLAKLGLEIYDPYEHGPQGVSLRKVEDEDEDE